MSGSLKFISVKSARSHGRCEECKRRKKKCDETKPVCASCLKRGVPCVYKKYAKKGVRKPRRESGLGGAGQIGSGAMQGAGSISTASGSISLPPEPRSSSSDTSQPTSQTVSRPSEPMESIPSIPSISSLAASSDSEARSTLDVQEPFTFVSECGPAIDSLDQTNGDFADIKSIIESILKGTGGGFLEQIKDEERQPDSSAPQTRSPSPTSGFGNAFEKQLRQLSLITSSSSGDSDMELGARAFLNNFKYFVSDSDKYNRSFSLFLPLAYQSKAVLYAVCGWGMIISKTANQDKALEYLKKSKGYCDIIKRKLDSDPESVDRMELISLVVCLTCHVLVSSSRGNTDEWKQSFEHLYDTLRRVGLEQFFKNVRDSPAGLWVLNCFFYNDVLKVIKVTDDNKVGTLFPLSEYQKIISFNFDDIEQSLDNEDGSTPPLSVASTMDLVDPVMGCCIGLFFRLAELNNLYDIFIVKIHALDNHWAPLRATMEGKSDAFKLEFVRSARYRHYEDIRMRFHDWVEMHTTRLDKRIKETLPRVAALSQIRNPKERELHLTYFRVLQLALLLFLQIKLKEAPLRSMRVKSLMVHCYRNMRQLIVPGFVRRLTFPLLVTGAAACEERDRVVVHGLYLQMAVISESPNLRKVWTILKEFWELNPRGDTWELSQNIINRFDWNTCLI